MSIAQSGLRRVAHDEYSRVAKRLGQLEEATRTTNVRLAGLEHSQHKTEIYMKEILNLLTPEGHRIHQEPGD